MRYNKNIRILASLILPTLGLTSVAAAHSSFDISCPSIQELQDNLDVSEPNGETLFEISFQATESFSGQTPLWSQTPIWYSSHSEIENGVKLKFSHLIRPDVFNLPPPFQLHCIYNAKLSYDPMANEKNASDGTLPRPTEAPVVLSLKNLLPANSEKTLSCRVTDPKEGKFTCQTQ